MITKDLADTLPCHQGTSNTISVNLDQVIINLDVVLEYSVDRQNYGFKARNSISVEVFTLSLGSENCVKVNYRVK